MLLTGGSIGALGVLGLRGGIVSYARFDFVSIENGRWC